MKKELPSGWQELKLKDILHISLKKYDPKKDETNYKCIELEHIESNTGILKGYTNSTKQLSVKNMFQNGDILYGKLRPYLKKFYNAKFDGVCSSEIWVLKGKNVINNFLYYFIQSSEFNYIANVSYGTKMPRADWNYMAETTFLVPPLDEQKRIADILSVFDDLIENLTKLIEKKELYKKGVMQRVLTGKVRFNGFKDEWEEVYIKDVGTIITGNTPSTKDKSFWGGKHIWVTPTDINKKDIDNSERKLTDIGLSKARKLPKNTLLVTCIASIGKNSILRCEGSCNQQINAIIPNKNFSAEFLYYIFENNKEYLNAKAPASATKIISKTEFEKLSFIFPKIEEQNKIAELLTLIDKDIEILKRLLYLRKLQKKGVMQKLLTGEVRV